MRKLNIPIDDFLQIMGLTMKSLPRLKEEIVSGCREKVSQGHVTGLFDRLKVNEESVIKRHTSLLDFPKLGYNARATIMIKVGKEDRQQVSEYLQKNPSVNSCSRINQDYDFIIDAVFQQVQDAQRFIEAMENRFDIQDTKLFYIMDEIARERFLADPQLLPLD